MHPALLIGDGGTGACPVCGGNCSGSLASDHLSTYPFKPGGRPKVPGVEGVDYVIAPDAVHDPALERNVYGAGDRVPMADAIKYGLADGPVEQADAQQVPARGRRAKHGPEHDRSRQSLAEDR